jgi:hypothetical protein
VLAQLLERLLRQPQLLLLAQLLERLLRELQLLLLRLQGELARDGKVEA